MRMSSPIITLFLTFGCLVHSSFADAQAGDGPSDRQTLKGISAFSALAIVDAPPDVSNANSIQASLQTLVELCLRRDGIGVLDPTTIGPSVVFYVHVFSVKSVRGTEIGYAANSRL